MNKSLTICFPTARKKPCFYDWFIESLLPQVFAEDIIEVIQVKHGASPDVIRFTAPSGAIVEFRTVPPKPTIWSGPGKITKDEWWSKSNDLNTAICLARNEWFATCDDRSVLLPSWLEAVRRAMQGGYAVAGAYEKRHNLKVENGVITDMGHCDGTDPRSPAGADHRASVHNEPVAAPASWWFGCTNALPMEWCLQVNGYEELLNGLGMEDVIFGMMLSNNGYPIKYDPRMKAIQDRTPGETGPVMKRSSFERWPNDKQDKGHAALKRFSHCKQAQHPVDIRALRGSVLVGNPFPPVAAEPHLDWWNKQRIDSL